MHKVLLGMLLQYYNYTSMLLDTCTYISTESYMQDVSINQTLYTLTLLYKLLAIALLCAQQRMHTNKRCAPNNAPVQHVMFMCYYACCR